MKYRHGIHTSVCSSVGIRCKAVWATIQMFVIGHLAMGENIQYFALLCSNIKTTIIHRSKQSNATMQ